MENLKELQLTEAVKRMQALHIMPKVINDYKRSKIVYYSERQNQFFDGILYYVKNNSEYVDIIEKFEKKHDAIVYHAQLSHTFMGELLTLLYVSKDVSEWDADMDALKHGDTVAYVCNLSDADCSEFGWVGIKGKNGGVTRTY